MNNDNSHEVTEVRSDVETKKRLGPITMGLIIIGVIGLIILAINLYFANRWKYDLNVRYLGYNNDAEEYEIINNTNRTLKDVVITFEVDDIARDFKFEYPLGRLNIGETTVVRLYWDRVKEEAEKADFTIIWASGVDIVRIMYD